MTVRFPNPVIRALETIRRTKIFVPGQGELRGHLIAEALEDTVLPSRFIGRNLAANLDGSLNVPPKPSGIALSHLGGGVVDIAITDQANHPAINYFVEVADNDGFIGARTVYSGPSRNAMAVLPNGKWHVRVFSQYQYSGSPSNAAGSVPTGQITVTGSVATGTLLPTQGSGTGSKAGTGFGTP